MRLTTFFILLVFALFAPGLRAQETASSDLAWLTGDPKDYPTAQLSLSDDPPSGVEPLDGAGKVSYVRRDLAEDRKLLMALQIDPAPGWIRVDLDFDGELADEDPLTFMTAGSTRYASLTLELPLRGAEKPVRVPVKVTCFGQKGSESLRINTAVHREGGVVLGDRHRRVALIDGDADLRFDGASDLLLLDRDGDTELDRYGASADRIRSGVPFRIGDRGFVAQVEGEARIGFRPVEEVPPAPPPAWQKYGTPRGGSKAPAPAADLAELLRRYEAAAGEDRKVSASSITHRLRALPEIGKVGTPEAFRTLLGLYDKESNQSLKAAAVRGVGYLCYREFHAQVAKIAGESGLSSVRSAAISALHGMDAPGRAALYMELARKESDESVFSAAARNLAYLKLPRGIRLLDEIARGHAKPAFRYHAYQNVARYRDGPPPPALVLSAARSEEARLRALGLEHAFILSLPQAREIALGSLGVEDEKVRLQVVRILGIAGDVEAVRALLGIAPAATSAVRTSLVRLLRPVRDPASVDVLVAALGQGAPESRSLVADILAGIPEAVVTEALVARLSKEKDGDVLASLVRAVGAHGAAGATGAIVRAAEGAKKSPETLAAALDTLARIGFADPDVRRFFEKILRSGDTRRRMIAVDAAALSGDESAAPLLLDALADKAWMVRLAAVQGLARIRVKRAVPVLIEQLEKEEAPRVRQAIAESLYRITGENYYDIVRLWKRWWEEEGEDFEVPARVPERKRDDHGGQSVASFYGVPVHSDRIIFVIDQSGSMSGMAGDVTKLTRAVEETLKVVKKLGKGARLNVILFETTIHPWQKRLVKVGGATRAALAKHLRSKRPTGGTNLYDGLEMALLTKEVDTIFLLSDGAPGSGKFVRHEDIVREIGKLNRTRRVAIHCIAVGFDSPLMKELAAENDGRYVKR